MIVPISLDSGNSVTFFLNSPTYQTADCFGCPSDWYIFFQFLHDLRTTFCLKWPKPKISTETVKNAQHISEFVFCTFLRGTSPWIPSQFDDVPEQLTPVWV